VRASAGVSSSRINTRSGQSVFTHSRDISPLCEIRKKLQSGNYGTPKDTTAGQTVQQEKLQILVQKCPKSNITMLPSAEQYLCSKSLLEKGLILLMMLFVSSEV
jgi:hypothetical protein